MRVAVARTASCRVPSVPETAVTNTLWAALTATVASGVNSTRKLAVPPEARLATGTPAPVIAVVMSLPPAAASK